MGNAYGKTLGSAKLHDPISCGWGVKDRAVMNVFNVTDKASAEESYENMKKRAIEILEKNTWLMGRYSAGMHGWSVGIFENFQEPKEYIKELVGDKYFHESLVDFMEPFQNFIINVHPFRDNEDFDEGSKSQWIGIFKN